MPATPKMSNPVAGVDVVRPGHAGYCRRDGTCARLGYSRSATRYLVRDSWSRSIICAFDTFSRCDEFIGEYSHLLRMHDYPTSRSNYWNRQDPQAGVDAGIDQYLSHTARRDRCHVGRRRGTGPVDVLPVSPTDRVSGSNTAARDIRSRSGCFVYRSKYFWRASESRVCDSASMRRTRAFCGLRLSVKHATPTAESTGCNCSSP
jgi:hypothetical protein